MKTSTIKNANIKSQNAGHVVRSTASTVVTETADALWLLGTSIFSFGKGLVTTPKVAAPPRKQVAKKVVRTAKH
jgi:hypothetical protein